MVTTRREIEAALAAWRDAERRLAGSPDGHHEELAAEVARHRDHFHELSGRYMANRIDLLKGAEERRRGSVASTPRFHQAAREEKELAAEIWDEARRSDEDTP